MPDESNSLYYGDNLDILRRYIPDESVDLIYLDPPFNSSRDYNVLFAEKDGARASAQIKAFEDTWRWDASAAAAYEQTVEAGGKVSQVLQSFRAFLGDNDMLAYLSMMAPRLVELRRVLKDTGSLYLHCDPTASHYLKLVLDAVFGPTRFMNNIVWQRSDTHNDARRQFPSTSDHILLYSKGDEPTFHTQYVGHAEKTLRDWYSYLDLPDGTTRRMTLHERETQQIPLGARRFNTDNMTSPNPRPNMMYEYKGYSYPAKGWRYSRETMEELDAKGLLLFPKDPKGRIMFKRYLDEQKGAVLGDVWTDISQLRGATAERLGYPTQKPEALLERIITASSSEGAVILDPFCGCGTTIAAAEKLKRRWIGVDITHLAIGLIRTRLRDTYGDTVRFEVIGEPTTVEDAEELAKTDPYQFEWWALGLVGARKAEPKKGADKGIDGRLFFHDGTMGTRQAIFSVKAGHVTSSQVRDLVGVITREKAELGVLISFEEPTREMRKEAASAGFFEAWGNKYPKVQLVTVGELLGGKTIDMPRMTGSNRTFKQAPKRKGKKEDHPELFGEK